ncbi:MAG: hypothetical protein ACOCXA_02855, partial [Planctomycetota bacterium]
MAETEIQVKRKPARSWWWRWMRRLLLFVLFIIVLLVLAWPWRWQILGPILRPLLQAQLGPLVQADMQIGAFEGSIVGGIGIRGFQAQPRQDSLLQEPARIGHLSVQWRPWALLWGEQPIDAIELSDVVLDLSLPASKTRAPTVEQQRGLSKSLRRILGYLPILDELPETRISDVTVRIDDLLIRDADLRVRQSQEGTDATASVARLEAGAALAPLTGLRLRLTRRGGLVQLGDAAQPGLTGELGDGDLALWGQYQAEQDRLALQLKGEHMLVLGGPEDAVRRVRADADLRISGTPEALRVDGDVAIPALYWHKEFAGGAKAPSERQIERGNPLEDLGVELPMHPRGGLAISALAGAEFIEL